MKVNWGVVQIACLAGLVAILKIFFELGGRGIAPREGMGLLLPTVAGSACFLGAIAAGVMQRRRAAEAPPVELIRAPEPAEAEAISATYCNTADAARRCEMYNLTNKTGQLVVFTVVGLIGAAFIAMEIAKVSHTAALIAFPLLHLAASGALFAYMAFLLFVMIRARFPAPYSVRVCTTSLTRRGFRDDTPDKLIVYSWDQIREIREVGGDVFFWTALGGCYIPRSGFEGIDVARRYHRAAVTLWKSRGRIWPDEEGRVDDPGDLFVDSATAGDAAGGRSPYLKVVQWAFAMLAADSLAVVAVAFVR